MEAGQGLALDAGKQVLENGGIYGPITVLLALSLLSVVIFGWRALAKLGDKNDALYDRLIASEQKHQSDIAAVNVQRAAEIATLAKIAESYTPKGR